MDSQDYVIDQKRGMAWANPYEAMCWYRERLDSVMPERPDSEVIQAIYAAWEHYGPASEKRFLGTPEAERIYREIRKVLAAREQA